MATGPVRNNRSLRGGIDLGGTKIQAVVVSRTHRVLGEARRPTPATGGPEAVMAALVAALADAASSAGITVRSLAGVGIGTPGSVDAKAGTVSRARNLPDWEGTFPLGDRLSRLLGCPIRLGNDVQVANMAEMRLGAGRRRISFLGVSWGTGVGGSLVLDGRLWPGRSATPSWSGTAPSAPAAGAAAWRPTQDGPRWS
jgi:glucokinase